jgi:LacI family transcriptional regulator
MAITLKDIAKKVGVSPTTVSLVLNNKGDARISESTRNKVWEAAKEVGYQTTRGLPTAAQGIPPTIGLVITDIENPFFTKLASVIEDVASRYGYNIILCNTRKSLKREQKFLEVLWGRKIDGLIIAPVDDKKSDLEGFLRHHIPIVFVDRYMEDIETAAILLDNVKGAFMAVEHLIQLGHKRIGVITGRQNVMTGKDRLQGCLKAFEAHGVDVDTALLRNGHYTVEGGMQATKELLSLSPRPTAIFSCAGVPTVGALLELKHQSIKIPKDLSFISFDDEQWMQLVNPTITAISQPIKEIGTEAAQLVIQLIQGWSKGEARKILLEPTLIIRESCARTSS